MDTNITVTKKRVLNEVLVRFDLQGNFQGAHVRFASYLTADGSVPIAQPELEDASDADWQDATVQQYLGASLAQSLAMFNQAAAQLAQANALNGQLTARVAELEKAETERAVATVANAATAGN